MPENVDYVTLNDTITGLADEVNTLRTRENYSTTEQVVDTWIDGKPIYRKHWEHVDKASQTSFSLPNLKGIFKVDMNVLGKNGDINPVPVVNQGTTARWLASTTTQRLVYVENGDLGQYITLTIDFTKTTD